MTTDHEHLAHYQAMTPAERLRLGMELIAFAWRGFQLPDQETGDRKWAVWLREHDASNANLARALRLHKRQEAGSEPNPSV